MDRQHVTALEPLSYFLGAWLGDGWISLDNKSKQFRTGIAGVDKEVIYYCCSMLANYFSDVGKPSRTDEVMKSGIILYKATWNNPDLADFLYQATFNKEILPNYIWQASRESQLEMLAGLMDTDGSIGRMKGRKDLSYNYDLKFCGTKGFVKEVVLLFNVVGIETTNKRYERLAPPHASIRRFNIQLRSAVENGFYFRCTRKMQRLMDYVERSKYGKENYNR